MHQDFAFQVRLVSGQNPKSFLFHTLRPKSDFLDLRGFILRGSYPVNCEHTYIKGTAEVNNDSLQLNLHTGLMLMRKRSRLEWERSNLKI